MMLRSVNLKMTNVQRARIGSTLFKWLLYLSNMVNVSEKLVGEMCHRWDERRGGFRVGNKVLGFSAFDVCLLLGLPVVGIEIDFGKKQQCRTRQLFEGKYVTVRNIYEKILKLENDEDVEEFCILDILLGISEFLFPNQKSYIHSCFLILWMS
ncbi:hypothetical protein Fmac_007082 [Flemingia macrophylla]|uniref:Uncharacterized protein n=1 Tax=Flemingia macrophylla TaxID=520843 RepID=A0ABD1NDM4_9FABA